MIALALIGAEILLLIALLWAEIILLIALLGTEIPWMMIATTLDRNPICAQHAHHVVESSPLGENKAGTNSQLDFGHTGIARNPSLDLINIISHVPGFVLSSLLQGLVMKIKNSQHATNHIV